MDVGLKQLKVIKELAKALRAGSIFIQFDSEVVLSVRKPRVSSKEGFRGDN